MSGNIRIFGHKADRGRATSKCQGMAKHLGIQRTGAKLPVNVKEYPNIWIFGGQGPSYKYMSGNVQTF